MISDLWMIEEAWKEDPGSAFWHDQYSMIVVFAWTCFEVGLCTAQEMNFSPKICILLNTESMYFNGFSEMYISVACDLNAKHMFGSRVL